MNEIRSGLKMQKSNSVDKEKLNPFSKNKMRKKIILDKIESSWGNDNENNGSKNENKKLTIKLETSGKEKQKILLKLESRSSKVNASNYNLLSELLKDFFSNGENNESSPSGH